MSLRRDSNLGELGFQGVQDEIAQKKNPKGKLSTKSILRKIASKSASPRVKMEQLQLRENSKNSYPDMKESTVRGFKSNYEEEMKKAKQQSRTMTKALPEKKGRPLILGLLI